MKTPRAGMFLLSMFLIGVGPVFAASPPRGATPLVDVAFTVDHTYAITASFAQDGTRSYLGTPGGLYRLPAPLVSGSEATPAGFAGSEILGVYVHDAALYVLKVGAEASPGPATDHAFLRSSDGGETFVPLDDGLEECLGGYCSFLTPSQAAFCDGTIFLNAGGNLLASHEGGPWVPLIGEIARQACYDPAFAVSGNRVLVGGECPLDFAYVRAGVLRDGFLEWELPPDDVITPSLGNRNIQFLQFIGGDTVVIAGIEGAILRSSDGGASFDFAMFHEIDDPDIYPYVWSLVVPSTGDYLLAGGFDKAHMKPYLAWSGDEGRSWQDVSHVLGESAAGFDVLTFLHEEPSGRILAGLLDIEGSVLRIVELVKGDSRLRPVRRPSR